jgi:hypothetical protein
MEPPWESERYLLERPVFGYPGDPLAERGRRRSRQLERERREMEEWMIMHHQVIHVLHRLCDGPPPGMPPDEYEVRVLHRRNTLGRLDTRMLDAMSGAGAPCHHPRDIRGVDLEFLEPQHLRRSCNAHLEDEPLLPRPRGSPRREHSPALVLGHMLPAGGMFDLRLLPREVVIHDHLMGNPQANMLLGARPHPERSGTPLPDLGGRNSRW